MIVEGQLKSQPKSGLMWNAGLMRPIGKKQERGQRLEKSKNFLVLLLFLLFSNSMPIHVYTVAVLQDTAAKHGPISFQIRETLVAGVEKAVH